MTQLALDRHLPRRLWLSPYERAVKLAMRPRPPLPRIDYREANTQFKRQKAALTRAVNSGDRDRVVETVTQTVREWRDAPWHGAWPDDWSRWQRALDDVMPLGAILLLEEIR
jgi:hypothetical protein